MHSSTFLARLQTTLLARTTFPTTALMMAALVSPTEVQAQGEADCSKEPWTALERISGSYVLESAGAEVGSATITTVARGCGLSMSYTFGQDEVFSTATLGAEGGTWHETSITSSGSLARMSGRPTFDRGRLNQLELRGSVSQADGSENAVLSEYSRTASGLLRHSVKVERDEGWINAFDVTLVPATRSGARVTQVKPAPGEIGQPIPDPVPLEDPARANPATDAVVPGTTATGDVQPGIRPTQLSPKVSGSRSVGKVVVESPMSVELPLGPLDKIPPGYGWRSKDLAQYEIDGGTIETVEVKKQTKRKKTSLTVTFFGRSEAYTAEYELTIQIVTADGEPLTEVVTQKLYTGRAVGAQVTDGVSKAIIELDTDASAFDAAFEGGQRPVLQIKVVALG